MKTINREESISRSRFVDCPVCSNHTLKLKRSVQVGRCKSCNETYKIIVVFVKTGRKAKPHVAKPIGQVETKPEPVTEVSLPSWQLTSDNSLFGSSDSYPSLSDLGLKPEHSDQNSGTESGSGQ